MILTRNTHIPFYPYNLKNRITQRTSSCASGRASITIEAALVVPLFFLAIVSLLYMMEVMAIRTSIRSGMQYAAKAVAEEAYVKRFVTPGELETDIVKAAGSERLGRSIVVGGSSGIHCEESYLSPSTAVLKLKVSYEVRLPIPLYSKGAVPMEEEMMVKGWTGYEKSLFDHGDDQTVYITETGMVYHLDYHCTYLDLSIHMATAGSIEKLRNKSDGKYYPCEHCMQGAATGNVYITDYGDRYHSSLGCSGLKRTIYAVPLSEAAGKGGVFKMWEIIVARITVSGILCLGFLLGCSVEDIWQRRLSGSVLFMAGILAVGYCIYGIGWQQNSWEVHVAGLLVGAAFLLVSRVTREAIGYGDSLLICILGVYLGIWKLLEMLASTWLILAIVGMILLVKKRWSRKVTLPMVPFLTMGYCTLFFMGG